MTKRWRVIFTHAAARELRYMPRPASIRTSERIAALVEDALPAQSRKVAGTSYRRIRVGDARVLYAVDVDRREVTIVRVARNWESTRRRLR